MIFKKCMCKGVKLYFKDFIVQNDEKGISNGNNKRCKRMSSLYLYALC